MDELENQMNWNTMTTTINNTTTTKRNNTITTTMKNKTTTRKKQQHKARDGSVDIWVERDFHTETGPRLKQMTPVNLVITVGGEVVKMCDKGKNAQEEKRRPRRNGILRMVVGTAKLCQWMHFESQGIVHVSEAFNVSQREELS